MKVWSQEEINSFKYIMDEAPTISEGLDRASQELHRSKNACSVRLFFLRSAGYVCTKPRKRKTYEEEAKVLKEEIEKSPYCLQEAFEKTANRIGWKAESVEAYWYGVGNTEMSKHNIGVCFNLKGIPNTKNIIRK